MSVGVFLVLWHPLPCRTWTLFLGQYPVGIDYVFIGGRQWHCHCAHNGSVMDANVELCLVARFGLRAWACSAPYRACPYPASSSLPATAEKESIEMQMTRVICCRSVDGSPFSFICQHRAGPIVIVNLALLLWAQSLTSLNATEALYLTAFSFAATRAPLWFTSAEISGRCATACRGMQISDDLSYWLHAAQNRLASQLFPRLPFSAALSGLH